MRNRLNMLIYLGALIFFFGGPLRAQTPYGSEPFNGSISSSGWYTDKFGPLQWPADDLGNLAVRLQDCASTSPSSHCTTSTSGYGQEAGVATSTNVHAGFVCGSGNSAHPPLPGCEINDYGVGKQEETWYRVHIRLAPGYLATPNTQNTIFSFHVDSRTEADAKANGGVWAYSTMIDIQSDGTTCPGRPAFCTTPGTNPRLFLQVPGGPTSNPESAKRFFPFAPNSLLVNHWYDMVLHIVWSPTNGYIQWWVDGQKMVDVNTPTEYVRSDGTWSYAESLGIYNYRLWANWSSSVDGENVIWGPTADSINFNPGGGSTPPSAPPAPGSVSGNDSVTASANISWAASSDSAVSGYNVYRTTTSGSGYASVGTTSALSFSDNSVKVGTTYYYVVTAVANGVESPHSSEIQVYVNQ
jgi:Polysaccharide lyase